MDQDAEKILAVERLFQHDLCLLGTTSIRRLSPISQRHTRGTKAEPETSNFSPKLRQFLVERETSTMTTRKAVFARVLLRLNEISRIAVDHA